MEEASPALAQVFLGRLVSEHFFSRDCGAVSLTVAGQDLAGNTFWEFKDVINASRYRRIVRYDPKTHFSDVQVTRKSYIQPQTRFGRVASVLAQTGRTASYDDGWQLIRSLDTAQWHQWLRHVREHPPSIQEQQQDLVRQAQIKELARLADQRWASKPSFLDKPKTQQPPAQVSDVANASHPAPEPPASTFPETTPQAESAPTEQNSQKEENPWAKASNANPGEEWQPEAWSPSAKR